MKKELQRIKLSTSELGGFSYAFLARKLSRTLWALTVLLSASVFFPTTLAAETLVGLEFGTYSFAKEAKGIYRTPALDKNVDLKYTEDISFFGVAPFVEFGHLPGSTGFKLSAYLASSTTNLAGSGFTEATYDYLGFDQVQSETLAKKSPTVAVNQSMFGAEFLFKYNTPTDFPASNQGLKVLQKIIKGSGPWLGFGPVITSFTRRLDAVEGKSLAKTKLSILDFQFLVGGGFDIHLHELISQVPRNITVTMNMGFLINLTPDDANSVKDDTLSITEDGATFKFGVGYDL